MNQDQLKQAVARAALRQLERWAIVRDVLPRAVTVNPDGMLSLRPDGIIAYTVKAVQELNQQVEELRKENRIQQKRIEGLEKQLRKNL